MPSHSLSRSPWLPETLFESRLKCHEMPQPSSTLWDTFTIRVPLPISGYMLHRPLVQEG